MRPVKLLSAIVLLLGCFVAGAVGARPASPPVQAKDLGAIFGDTVGCFVLYDLRRDRYTRHNEARCRERFNPKSTFKIPNSLIGLESGVIKDADSLVAWDREKYPPDGWDTEPFINWKRDHTLRTAFKHSVVWYYRELARGVGAGRMQKYVESFGYGDANTSGAVDGFWLNNTLKISADEQVEFLKKLDAYRLPVSRRSVDIVKEIMVQEQTPRYTLRAKTGGGSVAEGRVIGWYVGYVTAGADTYYFAMNIEGPTYLSIRDRRIEIGRQILRSLGALPE